ncbi:two-component system response regulator YesN [Paenibacillus taihuensis]|uniref:Two-component system response regulator YesN n=1 Tax=Paenibacillus taihuensis TaxID=1156355 RepID=A0A3D9S777_9BACL|nr:response regulator [Paenibacillus taihuensis]REE85136.1 two-component system response regulator YesN [Paenibacillus taihuensis]
MYRVLIVDDEKEIREGLRLRFPWSDFSIDLDEVYTADDGESALLLTEELNPDMIVTDIKMSRMSGLEFIQSLRQRGGFSGKSIVISGYDDFDLVKQAMQLGAIDYVLKPINIDELSQVVTKAVGQIREERLDKQNKLLLENQVHFALPKMQEEMLREAAENEYNPYWETRMMHRLGNLQLEWLTQHNLALMIIEVDDLKAIDQGRLYRKEKELVLFGISNVVKQTLEEDYRCPSALYCDAKSRFVIVLSCMQQEQLARIKDIAVTCIDRINGYVKVKVSVGLASSIGGIKQLHKLFQEATDVLEHKAVYGGNRLLVRQDIGVDAEFCEVSLSNLNEVMDLIRYGSIDEIRTVMQAFSDFVRTWSTTHIRDIQQKIFEWLLELFKKAAAAGWKERSWEKNPIAIWDQLEQYDTLDSLRVQVESYVLAIAEDLHNQLVQQPQSQIISEAEKFIQRNYADNLTLHTVSLEVHVTPVWLSKLFKKEKRQTFLEYLTEVRIEKAKEMLSDVSNKIYQVSQEVGYRDPVHFTKLFKKNVGHTPKEYRKLRGINDE